MISRMWRQLDSVVSHGIAMNLAAQWTHSLLFRRRKRNIDTSRVHLSWYRLLIGKRDRYELRIQSGLSTLTLARCTFDAQRLLEAHISGDRDLSRGAAGNNGGAIPTNFAVANDTSRIDSEFICHGAFNRYDLRVQCFI